ncbi:MAG: AAA family ATPase [Candidatus Saccharimonadales bacterium]
MKQPIIHSRTLAALERHQSNPSHGLILSGKHGVGKTTIATWLATSLESEPIIIEAAPDTQSITIEQVRNLYQITRSGSPLTLIIKNAQTMSHEAQNAFLKLLEEPPAHTHFILTANHRDSLLATIQSRTQHIEVLPPPTDQIVATAQERSSIPVDEIQSLLRSVDMMPGRLFRLLENSELQKSHLARINTAKQFYSGPNYQRHLTCIMAKFERSWAIDLLDTLAIIVDSLVQANKTNAARLKKLMQQAEVIEEVAKDISARNASVKIQLTKLIENL